MGWSKNNTEGIICQDASSEYICISFFVSGNGKKGIKEATRLTSTRKTFLKRGGVKHMYAKVLQPQEEITEVEQEMSTICKNRRNKQGMITYFLTPLKLGTSS